MLLFTFCAAVRYAQVSLPTGCTVFVFNVSYSAATCFRHTFWPSSGSYKFDRSVQGIWQIVTDVFLPYKYLYYNNTTVNSNLHAQCVYS